MAHSGLYREKLGRQLRLKDTPSSLFTRAIRGIEVSATETRDDNPEPGLSNPIPPEDSYIVSLKFRDYPDCELWEGGKCVVKTDVRPGTIYLYDLKRDQGFVIDKPFHSLHFYLPRAALDGISQPGQPPVDQLDCQYGTGLDDEIVRNIGAAFMGHYAGRPRSISSSPIT